MGSAWKLPLAAAAALILLAAAPAKAQPVGGRAGINDFEQMERFAPMLEEMKRRMGKKRFARLMQTVGPMMDQMMAGTGPDGGRGFEAFGGGQTVDVGQIAALMDGSTIAALADAFAPTERPRSRRRAARSTDDNEPGRRGIPAFRGRGSPQESP
jgi:hypothetical protein